jgi:predicted nucleic acid-binding protein
MTMAWCFPDEATPHTEAVLDLLAGQHEIIVPTLWPYEVTSVLLGAVRRKRITSAKAREFIADLDSLNILIDEGTQNVFGRVYFLAERHQLTGYDAAYLELALRKQLPLASLDRDLNEAAATEGVALVQP